MRSPNLTLRLESPTTSTSLPAQVYATASEANPPCAAHPPATIQRLEVSDPKPPTPTPAPSRRKVTPPVDSAIAPWLLRLAYPLGRFVLFPFYFGRVRISGQEHLPTSGPVILAPTHRSRWDALMMPFATGHHVTGRHLRFMVSADEVTGLQGWFIRRMGGFPINTDRPAIASLRHGVELLEAGEMVVIFPEGNIYREPEVQPLKPGLARIALQAESSQPNLGVKIVPISIQYNQPLVPWRTQAQGHIGPAIPVADYMTGNPKQDGKLLTTALQTAMNRLTPWEP